MEKIKVRIINKSKNILPAYETDLAVGMDLRADIENECETIIIKPFERALIKTKLFVELPEGYEFQIRPRSGLALKKGITVLNSPGTIDPDFRGEIGVILINLSQEDFLIKQGDKIAQMVIKKYEKAEWESVLVLSETNRGTGGFGHTGIK